MQPRDQLGRQIENAIEEPMAAYRAAAEGAVKRAFATALRGEKTPAERSGGAPANRTRRRTPDELTALGERFYAAVCANPGESMRFFAAALETTAGQLERPVAQLKRAGRVRSIGERAQTKYFPLIGEATDSKAVSA